MSRNLHFESFKLYLHGLLIFSGSSCFGLIRCCLFLNQLQLFRQLLTLSLLLSQVVCCLLKLRLCIFK
uniref:Uncharacterized protein n=1 Tax=Arundo donax TaxID=35708 RepID=A0A0A9FUR1_ARUDO